MSNSVDERVVSMKFENEQFEKGIKTSQQSVDSFNNTLNGMGRKGTALSSIASSVDMISSRFSALGIIGVTALQNIANKAVDVGTQLVKSLTIAPIAQGWQEYELKMGSVQTIMASTGAQLEDVNKYLEELNHYADKTIYSFSDMTNNIGKFTNAGVSLDKAVLAIKGISNEAAVSGANAQQASHAMYNFAQALSAGYVKLIDWKSIENAQMATVEFKNELIDTAVQLGTLSKQADGTYKVITTNANGSAMKETMSATKNFNDSLAYQWMTTDVLIETLGRYADETTEIGKKAYASAQDIKTFTMMMDTLKEAVGSGWAQTFEILFGNFEEAKSLWTNLGTIIGDFINKQAEARNRFLKSWKTLGGRDDVLMGLTFMFRGFEKIIRAVGTAFEETFGRIGLYRVVKFTEAFKDLAVTFDVKAIRSFERLKDTFSGIFSIAHIFTQAITAAIKALASAISYLSPVGDTILDFTAFLGRGLTALDRFITENKIFEKVFSSLGTTIKPVADGIKMGLSGVLDLLKTMGSKGAEAISSFGNVLKGISGVGEKIQLIFSGLGSVINGLLDGLVVVLSKLGTAIGGFIKGVVGNLDILDVMLSTVLVGNGIRIAEFIKSFTNTSDEIRSFTEVLKDFFKNYKDIPKKIGDVLGSAKDALKAFVMEVQATSLMKIAIAIGILAIALAALASLDTSELAKGLIGLGGILSGFIMFIQKLTLIENFKGKQLFATAASLILIGTSLLLIAGALKIFGSMSFEQIINGLIGMSGALLAISLAMNTLPEKIGVQSLSLIAVGSALMVVAAALKIFGSMNMEEIANGLTALGGSLAFLAVGFAALDGLKNIGKVSLALMGAATAILILAPALKILGSMDTDSIVHAMVAIAGALMVLGTASVFLDEQAGNMAKISGTLAAFGAAILVLAPALKLMGTLDNDAITRSIIAVGGVLAGLGMAAALLEDHIGNMYKVSGALAALAVAMLLFAPALAAIGNLPTDVIIKALVATGVALAGFAMIAIALEAAVGPMLLIAGAITLLGVAVLAAGVGVAAFGIGLATLAALGADAAKNITNSLLAVGKAIPELAIMLAAGFVNFVSVLADNAKTLVTSILKILKELIAQIAEMIPELVEIGIQLILALLTAIRDHLPEIVDLGMEIIIGLIHGIGEHIQDLVTEAGHVIAEFIRGLSNSMGDIMDAGIEFMDTLAQGIENNIDAITRNIGDIITAFINGVSRESDRIMQAGKDAIIKFITGLGDCAIEIANAATDVIVKFCEALGNNAELIMWAVSNLFTQIKSAFAENFPTLANFLGIEAEEVSWEIPEGMRGGIENNANVVTEAIDGVGHSAIDSLKSLTTPIAQAASENGSVVGPSTASGIISNTGVATGAVQSLGSSVSSVISALGGKLQEVGTKSGAQTGEGVASGVESGTGRAKASVQTLNNNVTNAVRAIGPRLQSEGDTAGAMACSGLAAGMERLRGAVIAKAQSIASSAAAALRSALDINSPSRVTMAIGRSFTEGLALGIDKLIPSAEKSSTNLAKRIIDAAKTFLKISSPSKVARDEIGNYIVEGIAEGIDENTSAEDAASKKAQNIINAFKTELDKADLTDSINKLEYQLWETLNPDADEQTKQSKALELHMKDLETQTDRVNLLLGRLAVTRTEFGEDSEEYRTAYNDFMKEVVTYAENISTLKTLADSMNTESKDINGEIVKWYLNNQETVIDMKEKLKMTDDEIRDYVMKQIGVDTDSNSAYINQVRAALSDYGSFIEQMTEALQTGNLANMEFFEAGNSYAETIADGVKAGTNTVEEQSQEVAESAVEQVEGMQKEMMSAGEKLMVKLAEGIKVKGEAAVAAAKKVAAEVAAITSSMDFFEQSSTIADSRKETDNIDLVNASGSFSREFALKTNTAITKIRAIKTTKTLESEKDSKSSNTSGNYTVNFTQNNNSPKALSNADIYRQTKTLLAKSKIETAKNISKGAALHAS